ncbi:hypothetical protein KGY77_05425 [Candidatus Bipolaricaulota bacterium]|nr:hypothetical protein [Candidatus Bipolaricaulota bacterium]
MDSPMATEITEVFQRDSNLYDREMKKLTGVKKSLESRYPHPQGGALRTIHGSATAISKHPQTDAFIPDHRAGYFA